METQVKDTNVNENEKVDSTQINEGESKEVKTYTEEEVQQLLQSETDRRVTSALKKQQAKFEKEQSEAEKLRSMDAEQRKNYEFEKKVEEFEAQKKEFALTQNKLEATKVMAERNLPVQFVNYIVAEDADTMMQNITNFEMEWKAAIEDAVSKKIGSKTPSNGISQSGLTQEAFDKMNLMEKSELFKTNPRLYKQFAHSEI
jgi:hypothetical protein